MNRNEYGSLEIDEDFLQDSVINLKDQGSRRWSVLDKLERRHYCRVRSCNDFLESLNGRCFLATIMLGTFFLLMISLTRTLFFAADFGTGRYDYIVVGSGPGGSVITKHLVDRGAKVLLLEAGGNTQYDLGGTDSFGGPVTRFDIPLMWTSVSTDEDFHWTGFNIPGIYLAKGLGGCGAHNAMLYVRALASDFVKWNLKSWTWEKVLSIYKSIETYAPENDGDITADYHGTTGPFITSPPLYYDEISSLFISSAVQHGVEYNPDFNNPSRRVGVGYYNFNIKNGMRDSAAREFLGPLLSDSPPNFHLEMNAEVKRVILSKSPNPEDETSGHKLSSSYQVIGIEYEQGGVLKTAYLDATTLSVNKRFKSSRSVILAAGAIMTPKILIQSGIGPLEEIKKAGVEPKVINSWVGKNLQDHPAVGVLVQLKPEILSRFPNAYSLMNHWQDYIDTVMKSRSGIAVDLADYGILGSTGLAAGAFLLSPWAEENVPDIQLTVFPSISEPSFVDKASQEGEEVWNRKDIKPWAMKGKKSPYINHMLITVALLNPEARYELHVNESNVEGPLLFEVPKGKYLSDLDVAKLSWGVSQVRKIVNEAPLVNMTNGVSSPSPSLSSERQLQDWVRTTTYPNSHWVGTARMGANPQDSVTDEELRVWGVHGLRISDTSVMPFIPNGNVHSSVLVVSTMAAQFIANEIATAA